MNHHKKTHNNELTGGVGLAGDLWQREEMISTAAYFRAEKRGFAPGCEDDDWRAATDEIGKMINAN